MGQIDEEQAALESQVRLSVVAHNFLDSAIGRYLIARAEAQRVAAIEVLVQTDPEDTRAMRAVQNEIRVVDSIQQWLADAIDAGASAADQMRMRDSE